MIVRRESVNVKRVMGMVAVLALMHIVAGLGRTREIRAAENDTQASNDQAIRKVVAGFSEGWNRHDAAIMCASAADDVQWITWSGGVVHGRDKVQSMHASNFSGKEKDIHRVDEVKSITYLRPDLASVDDYWSMTGSHPFYRAGYVNFLMEHRGERWLIVVAHTADFNAKQPEGAK